MRSDKVKSFTEDEVEYSVNLNELTCTCNDWSLERFIFNKDDPRRLCKHLIASFKDDITYEDYSNDTEVIVPKQLIPFGKTISTCKLKKKGFYRFKDFYIYNHFIIAKSNNPIYIDVWIKNENKLQQNYVENYWYKATFKNTRIVDFGEGNKLIAAGWYGGDGGMDTF